MGAPLWSWKLALRAKTFCTCVLYRIINGSLAVPPIRGFLLHHCDLWRVFGLAQVHHGKFAIVRDFASDAVACPRVRNSLPVGGAIENVFIAGQAMPDAGITCRQQIRPQFWATETKEFFAVADGELCLHWRHNREA